MTHYPVYLCTICGHECKGVASTTKHSKFTGHMSFKEMVIV